MDYSSKSLEEKINDVLPQTHCQKCGFESCRPYAKAITMGKADINRCPPGGKNVVIKLSRITGKSLKEIDLQCGRPEPPKLVSIKESICIGCGLCLPACPIDAIAGARKFMHSIIRDECSGCNLCLNVCPVDCIVIEERPRDLSWDEQKKEKSKQKFAVKKSRLSKKNNSSDFRNSIVDSLKKDLSKFK